MAGFLAHNPRIRSKNIISEDGPCTRQRQTVTISIKTEQKHNLKIAGAVEFIFTQEDIKTKEELDEWCGQKGRDKLYKYIKVMAPEHWATLQCPQSTVRNYYEAKLTGYKINAKKSKK